MSQYIFLDNWVLSDYTKPDVQDYLSIYIRNKQLTVVINSLSLTELYNPGWANSQGNDRISRVAKFIKDHPTIIVDPVKIFRAEIENYPQPVQSLPIELDFATLPVEHREQALKLFLQHDKLFLNQGKDIRIWVESYKKEKSNWLDNVEKIIDKAIQSGILIRDETGRFMQLEKGKEDFLVTLDRRHFSHFNAIERENLGTKIVELFMGETAKLPAIRFTSLCFWYAYIQTDKTHPISRAPSDIGDFLQMSMIPYCNVFTTDNKMHWLSKHIMNETNQSSCIILNKNELDKEIGIST